MHTKFPWVSVANLCLGIFQTYAEALPILHVTQCCGESNDVVFWSPVGYYQSNITSHSHATTCYNLPLLTLLIIAEKQVTPIANGLVAQKLMKKSSAEHKVVTYKPP